MASDFRKQFGQRVRKARVAMKMTQESLAHASGVHPTNVSFIECGRRSVRVETIERLARALRVQPAALMPPIRFRP